MSNYSVWCAGSIEYEGQYPIIIFVTDNYTVKDFEKAFPHLKTAGEGYCFCGTHSSLKGAWNEHLEYGNRLSDIAERLGLPAEIKSAEDEILVRSKVHTVYYGSVPNFSGFINGAGVL